MKLPALTFAAVFIEIALCVTAITKFELWLVAALLAAYHAGYFLSGGRTPKLWVVLGLLSLAGGLVSGAPAWLALGAFGMNSGIQGARTALKQAGPSGTGAKYAAKFGAMAAVSLTALMGLLDFSLAAVSAAAALLVFLTKEHAKDAAWYWCSGQEGLLWAELLHHAHYFLYCYILWAKFESGVYPYIGLLFALGWLGYGLMETISKRAGAAHGLAILAGGHVLCALTILAMAFTDSGPLLALLWGLTGLWGGSCYYLGRFSFTSQRETYENLGHFVGCALSAYICHVSGAKAAIITAAAVCLAVTLFAVSAMKGRSHHE